MTTQPHPEPSFARAFATMRNRFMGEESLRIEAEQQRDEARAERDALRAAVERLTAERDAMSIRCAEIDTSAERVDAAVVLIKGEA